MKTTRTYIFFLLLSITFSAFAEIPQETIKSVIDELVMKNPSGKADIEKGVRQVAYLWQEEDGDNETFISFCLDNYISDPKEKETVFLKISDYMEAINGHFSQMSQKLGWNVTIDTGPILPIDHKFSTLGLHSNVSEAYYRSKIAFIVTLNFPKRTLQEKEAIGDNRLSWAYARMGDIFTQRIPTEIRRQNSLVSNDGNRYIDAYNIYMGKLFNTKGKHIFSEDMMLLCHWNLRDEIKANYNKGADGIEKQRTVYEVMKRVIAQDIPIEVINSNEYDWNPFTNTIYKDGKAVTSSPESVVRYEKMLNNFHAMQRVDKYMGNTYIDRKFNDDMEIALSDVEKLFDQFLSAPELKKTGELIKKRLGRKLEAYDIWYDGFKPRADLNENILDEQVRTLYPNAEALEKDLPNILVKLGYSQERARYLAEKIAVDPARGSGHAAGASMKGQKARLRTRIPANGMNYKGYNIAIHEFGHNVEQTISLYDIDYYMLNGVPNTSFTEALAFVFQKRDLEILGIENNNPDRADMEVFDKVWSLYEIAGVSMLDIAVWKWMYANPDATATDLREAVTRLSKELWNKYYAPVFGIKDETVLAIYSHMINYPLYLSAYAFGQIIEFQLDEYMKGKDFASETDRIFKLGQLTPNIWIKKATGSDLSTEPLLEALRKMSR
jgi:Oligoendopeptidase F